MGFVVLACLIAATGYWVWRQQADGTTDQAERTADAVAHLRADQIAAWLDERHADAAVAGASPWLAEQASRLTSGGEPGAAGRVSARLVQYRRVYDYAAVLLLSQDGAVLASSPAGASFSPGARTSSLARRTARTGEVTWSDLYLGPDGRPRLETAAALVGLRKGRTPPGVIVFVSDPDDFLYPVLDEWPLPSASGETLLVERRGDRVVFLSELRFRQGTALHLTVPLDQSDLPAVMAVTGRSGAVRGRDYRGVPVFAGVRPVRGTSWHVVAKLDSAEVLAPIGRRGLLTAFVAVLLVAVAGLATLLVWRRRESQVSAALLAGERRYRTLVESLSAGVVVHAADTSIRLANPAAARLLGLSQDQLLGKTAMDPTWHFLDEDGAPLPLDDYPVNRVVASGEGFDGLVAGVVRSGGDPVWLLCNAQPITAAGQLEQVVVTFIDITEVARAHAAVQASERKFRETVEQLDEGYYSISSEGFILDHNPALATILGLPPGTDLRGRASPDFWYRPEDRAAYTRELELHGRVAGFVADIRTPQGKRAVVLNAHQVRDEAGHPLRTDGAATDITAIHEAQREIERLNADLEGRVEERTAELEAANAELESFAYSVSHDLRAPLRHIGGFSALLAERSGDRLDQRSAHYLDVITRSVEQMGTLIDDLLQFSRTGRAQLTIQPVDMDTIVLEALAPLRLETAGRDVEWSIAALPPAQADRALIRQVWANLLDNAVKYTRGASPAHISIAGEREDGEVVYVVRDNGVGFDMQYAHKLFGVFQRLHDVAEFEGTGIGLANVKRIVTRLHGRVWAESEPDEGAAFFFSLPAGKETT